MVTFRKVRHNLGLTIHVFSYIRMYKGVCAEIQNEIHWNEIDLNMTALPPVLSLSCIFPPPFFPCIFVPTRKS
jgi:hypothetical protein